MNQQTKVKITGCPEKKAKHKTKKKGCKRKQKKERSWFTKRSRAPHILRNGLQICPDMWYRSQRGTQDRRHETID